MDELGLKTTQVEVRNAHLAQAQKEIASLKTERAVLKSSVRDVLSILSNLVNAHDHVLTLISRIT